MNRIRHVEPRDTDAVYDICLRTGDAGDDATSLYDDPRLPGHVWAGPYVALEPEHGFVLVDADDSAIGYVLAALDSRQFEARLEASWLPALRQRYPAAEPRVSPADRIAVHLLHHPSVADDRWVDRYPSHLHIDLLPIAQGHGDGRRLIDRVVDALGADGSTGVHLGVSPRNTRAIGFYRRLGFVELEATEHHLVFGLRLA